MRGVLVAALVLGVGCKEDPQAKPGSAAAPAPATPTLAPSPVAEAPAPAPPAVEAPRVQPPPRPIEPVKSPEEIRREKVAAAFADAWCIMKRRDRAGLKEALKKGDLESASAMAIGFHELRAADPKWAEQVIARVVAQDCSAR